MKIKVEKKMYLRNAIYNKLESLVFSKDMIEAVTELARERTSVDGVHNLVQSEVKAILSSGIDEILIP
jgi:hypothetical protein